MRGYSGGMPSVAVGGSGSRLWGAHAPDRCWELKVGSCPAVRSGARSRRLPRKAVVVRRTSRPSFAGSQP